MGRKERGDGQDVTKVARSPDESRRGGKEGTTSSSTGKHRHLILRGQSLGIFQANVWGIGTNHPIMDKLGIPEARPTDRQTDRQANTKRVYVAHVNTIHIRPWGFISPVPTVLKFCQSAHCI